MVKKLLLSMLITTVFLVGCSSGSSASSKKETAEESKNTYKGIEYDVAYVYILNGRGTRDVDFFIFDYDSDSCIVATYWKNKKKKTGRSIKQATYGYDDSSKNNIWVVSGDITYHFVKEGNNLYAANDSNEKYKLSQDRFDRIYEKKSLDGVMIFLNGGPY